MKYICGTCGGVVGGALYVEKEKKWDKRVIGMDGCSSVNM